MELVTFGFNTSYRLLKKIEVIQLHLLDPYDRLMAFIFTTDGASAILQNLTLEIMVKYLKSLYMQLLS